MKMSELQSKQSFYVFTSQTIKTNTLGTLNMLGKTCLPPVHDLFINLRLCTVRYGAPP